MTLMRFIYRLTGLCFCCWGHGFREEHGLFAPTYPRSCPVCDPAEKALVA